MEQERYGTWMYKEVLKGEGWDNHEDSFEETLRREMLQYKGLYFLLQEDHKQLILDLESKQTEIGNLHRELKLSQLEAFNTKELGEGALFLYVSYILHDNMVNR